MAKGAVAGSAGAETWAAPPWDFCFFFSSVLDSVVGEEELEMLYIPEISETLGLSDAGTLNPVGFAMTSA